MSETDSNKMLLARMVSLLKCLLGAYFITGIMLIVVSLLLYKFSLSENIVDISIIVIYCVSSLAAGLFFSKGANKRRFLWGLGAGAAYFLIICLMSAIVEKDFNPLSNSCLTTLCICTGSGMLGAMFG